MKAEKSYFRFKNLISDFRTNDIANCMTNCITLDTTNCTTNCRTTGMKNCTRNLIRNLVPDYYKQNLSGAIVFSFYVKHCCEEIKSLIVANLLKT